VASTSALPQLNLATLAAVLAKLLGIRPEDRRDTVVAFATLAAILAAHSMLETARDTLFLEKLPARHLPFAYLVIAGLALIVSRLNQLATARLPRRKLLALSLLAGSAITGVFHPLVASGSAWALGALYVWTGLLATVVVVQFWLQLGATFDVSQAKRLFAVIGSGGLVGATAGSAAAALLLERYDARLLLLISALVFGLAAIVPLGFGSKPSTAPQRRRGSSQPRGGVLRLLRKDKYLQRLFWMVLVASVLVTGVDYLFKATVAAEAAEHGVVRLAGGSWKLGEFFAGYYAVINGGSLLVQLLVAPRLLRAVGVNRSLLLLPALMLMASGGFVVTLGLVPALLLKGADGTLRHSVYKTSSEILFLPLSRQVRERFKGFAEALGQRGGQALASLVILAATQVDARPQHIGMALVVLAVLWLATLVGLQPHYLELFRKQLREGMVDTEVAAPDLDLASFEALVSALSSEDDTEVLAALELFDSYGRTHLVPALILYHPVRAVVLRAFELFARTERRDVRRLMGRLVKHDDVEIRSAALRAVTLHDPDEALLRAHLDDPCPAVRCTALVGLIGAGFAAQREAHDKLHALIDEGDGEIRVALARALRHLPAESYHWVAMELASGAESELAVEVARSMAKVPDARYLPMLLPLLASRGARADARDALAAIGDPALDYVAERLSDPETPRAIRLHLPRTLSHFPGERPVGLLITALEREQDEGVALKILRGLGRRRASNEDVPVDRERILAVAQRTVERAITVLHWRLAVSAARAATPEDKTKGHTLLMNLLEEKEAHAIQRVFRLFHVLEPTEQFRVIYDGLRSDDSKVRASSRELLSHVAPDPLRAAMIAMVDDVPDDERLDRVLSFHDPPGRAEIEPLIAAVESSNTELRAPFRAVYVRILRAMLRDASAALRSIVGYHVAELGLDELRDDVVAATETCDRALGEVAKGALRLLSPHT